MSENVPGPAYRVRTERLLIRCWSPADAERLNAVLEVNLEHLRPWMAWAANEPTGLQQKIDRLRTYRSDFDAGRDFHYGIFTSEETGVLGAVGLHTRVGEGALEIGYWIGKDHINQGLATEAAAAMTRVGFEVEGVDRMEIHCGPDNIRSAAIPRKLGYSHEATLKRREVTGAGQRRDTMVWTLFADVYPETPAASAAIEAYDAADRRIL